MTPHDEHQEHDELRELLTDAVSDVEPEYRLDTIRTRTRRAHPRRAWLTVGGAVLAAAAVVTAVSVVNDDAPRRVGPAATDRTHPTALYFVGDTPAGPRLYREFQQLPSGPLEALEAITAATGPDDPDYRTPWPQDFFRAVRVDPDAIEVEVGDWSGPQVPITRAEAELFLQQVVYTVQAATHEDTLPVVFDGNPLAGFDVEGFDDARSVIGRERAAENDVLAPMSISDPVEGLPVQGSFVARGRGNSSESNVLWRIVRGDDVVLDGFTTAEGWGDRLYPWETEPIDVSELPPGEYTFVAATDDPSGGAEGYGSFTDTRTIIVD